MSLLGPEDEASRSAAAPAAAELLRSLGQAHLKPVLAQVLHNHPIKAPLSLAAEAQLQCIAELAVTGPGAFMAADGFRKSADQLIPQLRVARPERRNLSLVQALGGLAEAAGELQPGLLASELLEASRIVTKVWLVGRDEAVRDGAVRSLAPMLGAVSAEGFAQLVPELFAPLVQTLSRRGQLLGGVRCVASMLARMASGDATNFLDSHTNALLIALFPPMCSPTAELGSGQARVRSEVLRCFELLVKVRPNFVLRFLMGKIEDPRAQVEYAGSLGVLRHLMAHDEEDLVKHKKALVQQVARLAAGPHSPAVAREIGQLTIAFSSKGWLDEASARVFIPKLLQQAAQSDAAITAAVARLKPADQVASRQSLEQLRTMSDHILDLLTKGADQSMLPLLWSQFVPALTNNALAGALGIVCKCISEIGSRNLDGLALPQQNIAWADGLACPPEDSDAQTIPKQVMTVRLTALLGMPHERNQLGLNLLSAMKVLAKPIAPKLQQLWGSATTQLASHLSQAADTLKQPFWEEQLIRLFSATSDVCVISDTNVAGHWTGLELAQALTDQIKGCTGVLAGARPVLFKYLGLTLRKLEPEHVPAQLDCMFALANHGLAVEQEAMAQGIGFCATVHLELLVTKVNSVLSEASSSGKGGAGGWSMFSGQKPGKATTEPLQASVLLCIGWIAVYAPSELVEQHVEEQLVNTLTPMLWDVKTDFLRAVALRSIELICKALHSKHPGKVDVLKQRDELVDHCISLLSSTPEEGHKSKLLGMHACTRLVLLEPPLSLEATSRLVETALPFLSLDGESIKELLSAVCDMLAAILHQNCSQQCLEAMVDMLQGLLQSDVQLERERAVMTMHFLLTKFQEYFKEAPAASSADGDHSEQCSRCFAMLLPRAVDEAESIRTLAVKAARTVLTLQTELMGGSVKFADTIKTILDNLSSAGMQLKQHVQPEQEMEMTPSQELQTMVFIEQAVEGLCPLISHIQVQVLTRVLLDVMSNEQEQILCARAAACAFTLLLRDKVDGMAGSVVPILEECMDPLAQVGYQPTLSTAISGVACLASRHLPEALPVILEQPIPHSLVVVSLLQGVARENTKPAEANGTELLELLLDAVFADEGDAPESTEAKAEEGDKDAEEEEDVVADSSSLLSSSVAALSECLCVDDVALTAASPKWLPKLFTAAIIAISCTRYSQSQGCIGQDEGALTIDDAVEMTSVLLRRNGSTTVLEVLESLNDELLSSTISSAVGAFSDAIAQYIQPRSLLSGWVECCLPLLGEGVSEPRQLAAATCLGSVLSHVNAESSALKTGSRPLVSAIVSALLQTASVKSELVRHIVFQSLKGLVHVPPADVAELIPLAVTTLGNALCDEEAHITCIAASLLSQILSRCESYNYELMEGVLHTFLSCAQEMLERPEASLRESAAGLVAVLCKQGTGIESKVYRLLPGLLLHLDALDLAVRSACGSALKEFAAHPLMTELRTIVDSWCADTAGEWDALEKLFAETACLLASKEAEESMARRALESCSRMLCSQAVRTRCAAACFGLILLSKVTAAERELLNGAGFLGDVLEMLQNDDDEYVRAHIAQTLGNCQ